LVRWPWLPVNPTTFATAGSRPMMPTISVSWPASLERDVWAAWMAPCRRRVLLGKESFRYHPEQVPFSATVRSVIASMRGMPQHPREAPLVAAPHPLEGLARSLDRAGRARRPSPGRGGWRTSSAWWSAHTSREDRDRDGQRHRELPEQAAHQAAHQEDGVKTATSERLMASTVSRSPGSAERRLERGETRHPMPGTFSRRR